MSPDDPDGDKLIYELTQLTETAYQRRRKQSAQELGIRVSVLDKIVRHHRTQAEDEATALPHWKVEPVSEPVHGAELLDAIKAIFLRFIVLPKGAPDAIALWILHAWTADAGDISPFLVLTSPTKRCGKTSALILLLYLTPRSELASNISPSALFRYIEETRPTLLIDEADSFVRDNEELRGILNSGHTKAAANIIRNVEVKGEHKPRRFSTWAPKAIATIRALADTLEDRAVIVKLQRKPNAAKVERLRRRDCDEFAALRQKAARWALDNAPKLVDPDPAIPDMLNDRAADNWRPLVAIADLAGGHWPQTAREAARLLSGEGAESVNVELLADVWQAFGDRDVIRSADLVAQLTADPERPWAEWKHGKPLTQKQLAGLLGVFQVISTTVHPPGLPHAKGYKRADFEDLWAAYCPGQTEAQPNLTVSKGASVQVPVSPAQLSILPSVRSDGAHGSNNSELCKNYAGLHACTLPKAENGAGHEFNHHKGHAEHHAKLRLCDQCGGRATASNPLNQWDWRGRPEGIWLHPSCEHAWVETREDKRSSMRRPSVSDQLPDAGQLEIRELPQYLRSAPK
jgi:putative DNA primase/helicase